jgi:two-component system, cell cycle response regulator DivK
MKRRILMVEDNHIHRLLTQDFFTHQGYEVKGLEDGSHFLATVATFEPDLIMLDLKLPVIDGFSLLEQLHQSCWCQIPVIVVSAYSFESEKQRARKLGICHYFTKPTNLKALERCVALELSSLTSPPIDSQVD